MPLAAQWKNGAVRIEQSISIARPVEKVWAFIADAKNDPRWCPKVVSVEQVVGEGPGAQARYRVIHRPAPLKKPTELMVEVEEFNCPKHLHLRAEDGDGVFNVDYDLEATPEGTLLRQTDHIDWKIPKLARPIGRLMVSRDLRRQFASLKQLLEADG